MDKVRAATYERELLGKQVGGWTICPRLGNGASAVVFAAERDGRVAAVKVFDRELIERVGEEAQLARIKMEVKLVGQQHDHLVRIFGGGKCPETGHLYVVMERLDLNALSTRIANFPPDRIRPIIAQIADAARYLETIEAGLVHRDIKPDNIVITDDLTRAVLLDFGVLRPLDPTAENDRGSGQEFVATKRYSSPDYLMREEDDSADGWRALTFYQLGGVLHDLIMHKPLFIEFGPPQTRLTDAVRWTIPIIDNPDVPQDLQELARNCLEKDWHVRLQLVTWGDFSSTAPQRFDLESVKERIRKRLTAATMSGEPQEPKELADQVQTTLKDAANLIVASIREIRVKTQGFPPQEITFLPSPSHHEMRVLVTMRPSRSFALAHTLRIFVAVTLLDPRSSAIRITVHCISGDDAANWPEQGEDWSVLFAGSPAPGVLAQRLELMLHVAFDQAQANPSHAAIQLPFSPKD
jgi:eukaryotic-like serine/threonine-protein kinase